MEGHTNEISTQARGQLFFHEGASQGDCLLGPWACGTCFKLNQSSAVPLINQNRVADYKATKTGKNAKQKVQMAIKRTSCTLFCG